MKLKAAPGHLVCERVVESVSPGGIFLPGSEDRGPFRCKVIDVGGDIKDEPAPAKVGDIVIVAYGGTAIRLAGVEYAVVNFSDVIAKIVD